MKDQEDLLLNLTEREHDVLAGLVRGMSNAEIAQSLSLSIVTVKWYTRQIYNKLQLEDHADKRTAAIAIARQNHLELATQTPQLPADVGTFIGRKTEVEMLCSILRTPISRLINIVGLGGSGKTRIALHVAQQVSADFDGAVYHIDLQHARTADEMLVAILRGLGYTATTQIPLPVICKHLGQKRVLLIMDNVEQIQDASATLLSLLQESPQLHCLLSSRRELGISDETIFRLSGMSYPSQRHDKDALNYDAVAYFVLMVQQVNSQWNPSQEDLATIIEICQLLGGLPLAIKLAARQIPIISLQEVAVELNTNLDMLTTNMTDIPVRHRNIEQLLQWLTAELSTKQREIFCYFGLFQGDFSLEAALAITGMTQIDLRYFVQLGIIDVTQVGRFRLHPIVRHFARDQLNNSHHYQRGCELFIHYYVAFAKNLTSHLIRDSHALNQFEAEWSQISAAWQYATDLEDWASIRIMVEPIHLFTWRRSYFQEALALINLVQAVRLKDDSFLRAELIVRRLHIAIHLEPITNSILETLQEQVTILATDSRKRVYAFSLVILSLVLRSQNLTDEAYLASATAMNIYALEADDWGVLLSHYQLALIEIQQDRIPRALTHLREAERINKQVADPLIQALTIFRMAWIHWQDGSTRKSLHLLTQARIIAEPIADREMLAGIAQLKSVVYISRGEFDAATDQREMCLRYYRSVQDDQTIRYLLSHEFYRFLLAEDFSGAQHLLDTIYQEDPLLLTCADHLQFVVDGKTPTSEDLLARMQALGTPNLRLEAILTAGLFLPLFAILGDFTRVVRLAAKIQKCPNCPQWFHKLPATRDSLALAKNKLGIRQYDSLWQQANTTPAEHISIEMITSA